MYIVCTIAKLENEYLHEFCEHYLSIGFDKCIIYDNNLLDGEAPEAVLTDLIKGGHADVVDFRGMESCQHIAYNDCLKRHEDAWVLCVDCDELLTLNKHTSIGDYMHDTIPDDAACVKFNWKCYGDNGLVKQDGRHMKERFTLPFDKCFKINGQCHNKLYKSMVKCGLGIEYSIVSSHSPMLGCTCLRAYDSNGMGTSISSPMSKEVQWDTAYVSHYVTKTIQEFIEYKAIRGYPDGKHGSLTLDNAINAFFTYPNEMTADKIAVAEDTISRIRKEHGT